MISTIGRTALRPQLLRPKSVSTLAAPAEELKSAAEIPDFAHGIAPGQRLWQATDVAFARSDAFIDALVTPQDPVQRPLFIGLGRWRALKDLGGVRSDWKHLEATSQARDRWVDEWKNPKALLDPRAELEQGATKTVGLLRMLDAYAGHGVVDRTISHFLKKPTGDFKDFYQQLKANSPEPLPAWGQFSAWLTQTGLPMLESRVDGHRLHIQQSGFTLYPSEDLGNQADRWPLPLVVRFRDDEGIKTQRVLLEPDQTEVKLKARGRVRWADPNGSGMGWFRTHLPEAERQAQLRDLPELGLAQQTNIQINQWRQVRHGSEPVGKFYDTLLATKIQDPEWLDLLLYEMGTQQNWARPADRPAFKRFLADLARPAVGRMGMDFDPKDSEALTYQKAIFRSWLAGVGDPEALRAAQGVADHYRKTGEVVRGLETAASPELLEELVSKAGKGLREGKISPEVYPLVYWPGPEGGAALGRLLEEPDSRLSDEQRDELWKTMMYSTPSSDTVWQALILPDSPIPHPEKLAGLLAVGPYRSEMEQLPAAVRDQIGATGGPAETMADISDQIHDFLVQRNYLKAPQANPEGWLLS